MRVAVISDMHGNIMGLDAALADIRAAGVDQTICLGDCIQGGPQPAEVVARLRELACPIVMGNADSFLLTGKDTAGEPTPPERWTELLAVREWTLSKLSKADLDFIAGFAPTVEIPLDGTRKLLGFHGSPHSFDDIILPTTSEEDIQRMLGGFDPHILCGGHTHIQQIRHLGKSLYFGCGSTGYAWRHNQPTDRAKADPWAEYALLTVGENNSERLSLDFRRVPFDAEALIAVYLASGRPYAQEAADQYR
jgi:predicted phosphodiesterase